MPKSTNPNAPQKEYKNAVVTQGAAFRDSITYDQALAKLPHQSYKTKLATVLGRKVTTGNSKPYNSNPWTAYSSGGQKGKECDLDGGQVWRAMRFAGCWFLGFHVGGYNQFMFWHISNPPGKTKELTSINNTGTTVDMDAPVVTNTTLVPSVNNTTTSVPVVTSATAEKDIPKDLDDWEKW